MEQQSMHYNAEHSLLHNILFHPDILQRCSHDLDKITSKDFADDAAGELFDKLRALQSQQGEQTTTSLYSTLAAENAKGSIRALVQSLATSNYRSVGVDIEVTSAVTAILEAAQRRSLIDTAAHILGSTKESNGADIKTLILDAQNKIAKLATQVQASGNERSKPQHAVELACEYLHQIHQDKISGRCSALMTGFKSVDELTGGMRPGSLNIIAARPGIGKTALALNIAENVARLQDGQNKPVLLFSLEMPKAQIIKRLFTTFARATPKQVESGELSQEQWSKIYTGLKEMSINGSKDAQSCSLFIDDNVTRSASGIVDTAREIAKQFKGLALIVVDYIQLLKPEYRGQNRNTELAETSRILKLLAMEFEAPVIALSQLNRDIDRRANRKPVNSDLRDSGALEADADMILFISRDEQAKGEESNPNTSGVERALLSVSKNRHGGTGEINLKFIGAFSLFEEYKP